MQLYSTQTHAKHTHINTLCVSGKVAMLDSFDMAYKASIKFQEMETLTDVPIFKASFVTLTFCWHVY